MTLGGKQIISARDSNLIKVTRNERMSNSEKQVPVETTMRPGSRLMIAEKEEEEAEVVVEVYCGGGQY